MRGKKTSLLPKRERLSINARTTMSADVPDDGEQKEAERLLDKPFLLFVVAGRTLMSLTRTQYDALSPLARRVADFWGVQEKVD